MLPDRFSKFGLGDGEPVPYVALPWSLRGGTLSVTADAVPAPPKGEPRPRGPMNTGRGRVTRPLRFRF